MTMLELIERVQSELLAVAEDCYKAGKSLADLSSALNNDGKPRPAGHRRGRKSMPPEERIRVAQRMKEYWAARRALDDPLVSRKKGRIGGAE